MILGTGIDLCQISRIARAVRKDAFVRRVFTESERAYAAARHGRAEVYAGMFAAKEAVAKALGTGFDGFSLTDIEILHTDRGAPLVCLHGNAARLAGTDGGARMHVSISHDGGGAEGRAFAVASAVWESQV